MENALKLAYSLLILPIVEAIDRLTAAISASKGAPTPCTPSAPAVVEETPEPEPEKPAKAKGKAKADPKPEPKVEEPEIEVPTGPELADLMQPLKGTPYAAELVNYKKGELKCPDLLKDITDKGILAKMQEKINELLKKQADEDC